MNKIHSFPIRFFLSLLVFCLGSGLSIPGLLHASTQEAPSKIDCSKMPCSSVLPKAISFRKIEKKPYLAGYDAKGTLQGWIVLSTSIVKIPAYSGQPMVTLVGLDPKGTITGAKVVFHSEPILLVGIPESALTKFVQFYVGKKATSKVVVGKANKGEFSVDVISGATVTALAQNKTILDSARMMGISTGVIQIGSILPGAFVESKKILSWKQLSRMKIWGRLTVSEKQMGLPNPSGAFVDLWYTMADAPQIGRSILGDGDYNHLKKKLKPGEHLFVVLGNGSGSFKGSAFVRGGLFDRIRVEQGLQELFFRDTDYHNLSGSVAEGSPSFKEGAVFISRGSSINPGMPFQMVFLGSRYDGGGAFHRSFYQFKSTLEIPESVYKVKGGRNQSRIYVQAWKNHRASNWVLISFLLFVVFVFVLRKKTTSNLKLLSRLHLFSMVFSLFVIGFLFRSQPSVTQVLTLIDSAVKKWRWDLFLSEPSLFILWIFIAIVSIIWGRGVFCGWVCPYGAFNELCFKIGQKLKLPMYELPEKIHVKARYIRYFVLFSLIPLYLLWPSVGEKAAEIEPFKSTFFVYFWKRHWGFILWWVFLFGLSTFWFRFFCRYLCPLGGALAIFGSFRFSGPLRRVFCSSCKICTKTCEPRAIREDGTIDPRECLSCMECEANYRAEDVCPPLIGIKKLELKNDTSEKTKIQWIKLLEQKKDV